MIVYVSIGNSDDKLPQLEWSRLVTNVDLAARDFVTEVHGRWLSEPAQPWQNACWCLDVPDANVGPLKAHLAHLASAFRQESIAWAPAPATEFIGAS